MTFRVWLHDEMDRQGVSRRELARRLAAAHPGGATESVVDAYRTTLRRYLQADPSKQQQVPGKTARLAIGVALGVEAPLSDEDDEDEPLAAELHMAVVEMKRRLRDLERLERKVRVLA